MEKETKFSLYQKIEFIFQNIQVIISILGIIANIVTFCVFCRKRLRTTSYSAYYRSVAILDCIVLTQALKYWLRANFNVDLNLVTYLFCKLSDYFTHASGVSSILLMSAILVDRLVTILYHNQTKILKKTWFQFLVVTMFLLVSWVAFIHIPFSKQIVEIKTTTSLTFKWQPSSVIIVKKCALPDNAKRLKCLITFGILFVNLIINIALYVKLIGFVNKSRRKFSTRTSKMLMKDIKFAVSSTMITISSFISKLPLLVTLLLTTYSSLSREKLDMLFTVSMTFAIAGYAAVLFLNLMLNSIFYQEFMNMFRRAKRASF